MKNKIIQIMPAPQGSWISEIHRHGDNKWECSYPAAFLMLVEHKEDGGGTMRAVFPAGFEDRDFGYESCSSNLMLHQSEQDANAYLKDWKS